VLSKSIGHNVGDKELNESFGELIIQLINYSVCLEVKDKQTEYKTTVRR